MAGAGEHHLSTISRAVNPPVRLRFCRSPQLMADTKARSTFHHTQSITVYLKGLIFV